MARLKTDNICFYLLLLTVYLFAVSFCPAAQKLDAGRYITIDEISPGMKGYCLTAYHGTDIERFELEVVSVVHNMMPGRNAILVQGTDERFIHTGPVAGCSGSPVYIDNRMAGALAFGWMFSKDPLYGVTPIAEMLRIGEGDGHGPSDEKAGFAIDFSKPVDFARVYSQYTNAGRKMSQYGLGIRPLALPLVTSGIPAAVCEDLNAMIGPLGLTAVAGAEGGAEARGSADAKKLVPGASLAVPVVSGDIRMAIVGTVTEVVGDRVYGFGHNILGHGPSDFPMAGAQVHTVVSSVAQSFKFASPFEIIGAITADESTGIGGRIGAKPHLIPLAIKISRYNDTESRVYNCQMVNSKILTPVVLGAALAGAVRMRGDLPTDHIIRYKADMEIETSGIPGKIAFENVSTNDDISELLTESTGSVMLLMDNPYKKVAIKSMVFDVSVEAKNMQAHIWSVELAGSKVKPGEMLGVSVVVESVLADKKRYDCSLMVPKNLAPGQYELIICGASEYSEFIKQAAPYRFVPNNITSLIEIIDELLNIKKDKLYSILVLPPSGVAVERAELPDLPSTKAIILQDHKRTITTQPYQHRVERSVDAGVIILDKKSIQVTVEQ